MLIPNYTNSTIEIATNEKIKATPHLQAILKFKHYSEIEVFQYVAEEKSDLKDSIIEFAAELYSKDYNSTKIRSQIRTRFKVKVSHSDLKQMLIDNCQKFRENGFKYADYLSVKTKIKKLLNKGLANEIIYHKCFLTHYLKKDLFEQILQELEKEKIDN